MRFSCLFIGLAAAGCVEFEFNPKGNPDRDPPYRPVSIWIREDNTYSVDGLPSFLLLRPVMVDEKRRLREPEAQPAGTVILPAGTRLYFTDVHSVRSVTMRYINVYLYYWSGRKKVFVDAADILNSEPSYFSPDLAPAVRAVLRSHGE